MPSSRPRTHAVALGCFRCVGDPPITSRLDAIKQTTRGHTPLSVVQAASIRMQLAMADHDIEVLENMARHFIDRARLFQDTVAALSEQRAACRPLLTRIRTLPRDILARVSTFVCEEGINSGKKLVSPPFHTGSSMRQLKGNRVLDCTTMVEDFTRHAEQGESS